MLTLQKVLSLATPFAYAKDTRYNIHGVRIEHNSNQLCAKATDGHIAIIITTEYNDIHNLPTGNYTIELPKVEQLDKLLKIDNEYQITKKLILVNAEFPDFTRVIPTSNTEYAIENL
jgi:DNA polymerase III sliding clamp (beta) subunit (PCNA family)